MKKRLLGAILLIILIVPLLIIGSLPFKLLVMAISSAAMYEMMRVRKKTKPFPKIMQVLACILVPLFIWFGNDYYSTTYTLDYPIFTIAILIFLLPIVLFNDNEKYNINDALYLLGSSLFIGIAFNAFVIIRNINLAQIIYLALITIMTDMFAYFTGRLIGQHKLCEKISPNKTIEGAIGGSIVGTVVPSLFYLFVIYNNENVILIILLTFLFTIIGQVGDLLFSSIKRHYSIKDFSNLIPGHGGILDRFDSLLLVAVTYMLFLSIL